MNRPFVPIALGALALGALLAVHVWSGEPAVPQRAQLVAAVDITPLTRELAAVRKELAAIREAVADAEGIRGDVAKATGAVKAMDERMTELTKAFEKYAETTEPVIRALRPARRWEYRCLRNRSESSATHLGRQGWELVVAAQDWLFFRRPIPDAARP